LIWGNTENLLGKRVEWENTGAVRAGGSRLGGSCPGSGESLGKSDIKIA